MHNPRTYPHVCATTDSLCEYSTAGGKGWHGNGNHLGTYIDRCQPIEYDKNKKTDDLGYCDEDREEGAEGREGLHFTPHHSALPLEFLVVSFDPQSLPPPSLSS